MGELRVYAHTPGPNGDWHDLDSHLVAVATQAREFAAPFDCGDLAYWLGIWHDLGKINPDFQQYLKARYQGQSHRRVPHAVWGAALAYYLLRPKADSGAVWKAVSLPLAGHHTGLHDGGVLAQELDEFLTSNRQAVASMASYAKDLSAPPSTCLANVGNTREELLIRMLFSCLVDADYLDTERHLSPERESKRGRRPTLQELRDRMESNQLCLMRQAQGTCVNHIRREVYEDCIAAASGPPGVYRLTVPTGGGKTRSSMAFALRHAVANNLRRVIVGIPYTSIIDQTAKEYRTILGVEAVVEHHSLVPVPEDESQDERALRQRLATDNWDAPIIVTTTVQLFESLFANRPSRVRKLHNLARSVIVLDEVQTLPTELLEPTTDVLRALVEEYGATVVLSTATQPALEETLYLKAFRGIGVKEIVENYPSHFDALRRVQYEIPPAPVLWGEVAEEVRRQSEIMVIVNTRRDALALLDLLKDVDDVFHLSTLLCAAHRRVTLDKVKSRLKHAPVRLISTQVVEAGVDLDFSVVWRAMGPLDRIVQAAGRCNREGKLPNPGRVVIFEPSEGHAPRGPYKHGIEEARLLLRRHGADTLHNPEIYREYFGRLFAGEELDKHRIQPLRGDLNYPEVAKRYRLIEDTIPVVVSYGDSMTCIDAWKRDPSLANWQRLQPYMVGLNFWEAEHFRQDVWLEEITPGLYFWLGRYDDERGGVTPAMLDASDLIR